MVTHHTTQITIFCSPTAGHLYHDINIVPALVELRAVVLIRKSIAVKKVAKFLALSGLDQNLGLEGLSFS